MIYSTGDCRKWCPPITGNYLVDSGVNLDKILKFCMSFSFSSRFSSQNMKNTWNLYELSPFSKRYNQFSCQSFNNMDIWKFCLHCCTSTFTISIIVLLQKKKKKSEDANSTFNHHHTLTKIMANINDT